jgi:RHS repeat-associated protein
MTDASGEVYQHDEYFPSGETFVQERNGAEHSTYLFSGKEQDEETGLYYFGARYLEPRIGIWYGVDPLAEDYPNVSSYVYCNNNPVNLIDLDGRFPILINGRVGKDSERASWTYWSKSIRETIKAGTGYYHSQFMYVDGDKGRLPSTRINAGMVQGKADAASVYARLKGSIKGGQITEQLQVFSHSRGSAFASGYMQGLSAGIILLAEKDKIGFAYGKENIFQYSVNLAPHQSNWINYGNGTGSLNLNISHIGDPLSGNDATGNVINVQSIPYHDAFDQHGNATYNTELNFVLKVLENNTGNGNPTDQVKAGYLIYDKNRTYGDKSKVTQGSN